MHKIVYSLRQIAPAELPTVRDADGTARPATPGELLNMGIQHVNEDVYSCTEQLASDDAEAAATGERTWKHAGPPLPGIELGSGSVRERHAQLPATIKPKVLRSSVIRQTDTEVPSARALAQANIDEQAAAMAEFVGPVVRGGVATPLVDVGAPEALLVEAQRLAAIPNNGIARVTVPMADVAAAADVVEREGLIPHHWAGESAPR